MNDTLTNSNNSAKRSCAPDILRVIAMLYVCLLHGRSNIPNIKYSSPIIQTLTLLPAWSGVWIFFLISGYTLGLGLFSGKYNIISAESNKINWKSIWIFYSRRFIRLAPLYYFYIIVFEIISGNYIVNTSPLMLLKLCTFTFNGVDGIGGLGHLWYVSTAMQLYIVVPFIYILLNKIDEKFTIKLFFAVSLAGLLLRNIFYYCDFDWYRTTYTSFLGNLDLIVAGMILAKIRDRKKFEKYNLLSWILFLIVSLYNTYIYAF
ncbi:MAG: acyltransferase family protein, partial [Oscillospiraceae bacterium]